MVPIHFTKQVAERLAQLAKERGLPLADLVTRATEDFLARVAENGAPIGESGFRNGSATADATHHQAEINRRLAAWDAIYKSMQDALPKDLPRGHFVDDSRESIYGGPEGRGE